MVWGGFGIRVVAGATLALALAACASSQSGRDAGDSVRGTAREAASAAATPLSDVGLIKPEIPPALRGLDYPYGPVGDCAAILQEIAALDLELGEEIYRRAKDERSTIEKGGEAAADAASDAVVDLARDATNVVPFRSWVRRLSGAAKAQREVQRAIELGERRRAFLRGQGVAAGCAGAAPEPPVVEPAVVEPETPATLGQPPSLEN